MSFSISISGHSSEPHNAKVKEVFEQAVRDLKAMPGATLGGYFNSGDQTGGLSGKAEDVDAQPA